MRSSFGLLDSLRPLILRVRVTLMSRRGIIFLGNCFQGHSGFQVNRHSGLEAPDAPITSEGTRRPAERGGGGLPELGSQSYCRDTPQSQDMASLQAPGRFLSFSGHR